MLEPEIMRSAEDVISGPEKKWPRHQPGPASLIAVITLRHLLREEKQGTATSRPPFENEFSSRICLLPEGEIANPTPRTWSSEGGPARFSPTVGDGFRPV
jgi:hypothetical protein